MTQITSSVSFSKESKIPLVQSDESSSCGKICTYLFSCCFSRKQPEDKEIKAIHNVASVILTDSATSFSAGSRGDFSASKEVVESHSASTNPILIQSERSVYPNYGSIGEQKSEVFESQPQPDSAVPPVVLGTPNQSPKVGLINFSPLSETPSVQGSLSHSPGSTWSADIAALNRLTPSSTLSTFSKRTPAGTPEMVSDEEGPGPLILSTSLDANNPSPIALLTAGNLRSFNNSESLF